ncbi:PAQR family membrane homeostasis protein TrhA [Rhodovibrio salinarum]|nr:hemolysin III family protein [Rhodovibrio salinarum]
MSDPAAQPHLDDATTPERRDHPLTYAQARRGRRADAVVHLLGVPLGLIAAAVMLGRAALTPEAGALTWVSLLLYTATLIAMLVFSATYNMTRAEHRIERLRAIDHATIFLLIAGTYTPFMLVKVGGAWGAGFTAFVWVCALAGAALKIAFPRRLERVSIALYLLLGWSVVMTLNTLIESVAPAPLWLLLAGGVTYTAGVGIYLMKHATYHKALWHLFVLAAASLHYLAISLSVLG